jgi:type IV pilus assembly protein PilO
MDLQTLPWYGQFAVFLVIGAIVLGIFYYIHYSPNQATIKGLETQIENLDIEIRKAEREEKKLKQIQEELEAKRAVLEKLKSILPEKSEISQILKNIQSIIQNVKLEIVNFSPRGEQRKEVYIEKPINISIEGSYHNLGIFFDQLSKIKKIFTVDNLNIRPFNRMSRDFTIQASFTAVTYLYREQAERKKSSKRRRR